MTRPPTIVAMGGGGFMMEPQQPALDDYVLSLTEKARPRMCLLPTATGDSARLIGQFYDVFNDRPVDAVHLSLFHVTRPDLRAYLLGCDAIYVGGGNTANMLAIWRVHGVDTILREAWERGIVLAGVSAGMLCWFACGVTDSFGPVARFDDGLGFLPGSACPHFDGEADRRPTYHRLVAEGLPAGVAADDGAALVYRGTALHEVVSSRPGARAYRVSLGARGEVVEEALPTRCLLPSGRAPVAD